MTGPVRSAWTRWWPIAALALAATVSLRAVGGWDEATAARRIAASLRPGDLRLVSSVGCVYCAAARRWLDAHRIPYAECLIEHDAACAQAYREAGAPGTPLVQVAGRWQVGFSPQRVAQALQDRSAAAPR